MSDTVVRGFLCAFVFSWGLSGDGIPSAFGQGPVLPAKIEIVVKKNKSTKFSGTDYDNKAQNFLCEVQLKNKEFNKEFKKLKVELFVIGEDVGGKIFQMLDRASSECDLPKGAEHTFEGHEVVLEFDDNRVAKFGIKYGGYLVTVADETGKVIASKSVKTSYLNNLEKIKKVERGQKFNKQYNIISEMRQPAL